MNCKEYRQMQIDDYDSGQRGYHVPTAEDARKIRDELAWFETDELRTVYILNTPAGSWSYLERKDAEDWLPYFSDDCPNCEPDPCACCSITEEQTTGRQYAELEFAEDIP